MNIPSSSSSASSPSFNNPSSGDDAAAAARFNPLFSNASNTSPINHNLNHNLNQTHSSIGVDSDNRTSNGQNSISGVNHNQYSTSHNRNHNHNSINSIHNYHSINHKNSHSHKGIIATSMAAGNASPNSLQLFESSPSRKVHVVYYLSRSGQLEHPHLLEVSIPPNQGLYLRDVKKRLAAIRGKRLPLTFAWSYKRSYKNGYVWQDLCDDDLIFPAHGCEYVLKGSEILNEQSNIDDCGHTPSHNPEAGLITTQNGIKEDQGPTSIVPKGVYQNHEETEGAMHGSVSLHVSMVENGTDAATQTEEELRPSNVDTHEHEETSNNQYSNRYKLNAKYSLTSSPHKASCTTTRPQHATELNRTDIASPPSSSSATNSPSPYKELASTSSSSASGFNMAMEQNDNVASNEPVKASDCNLGSKTPGRTWMKCVTHKLEEQEEIISLHAVDEEGDVNDGGLSNPAHESASSKSKYRTMGSNSIGAVITEEGERSPAGSSKAGRSKHSGALSLLQFMSCGGLDIKEQILPMSLYRLRSKGPPTAANQLHMSNYILSPEHDGSESGKFWTKNDNQWAHRKHHHPPHEGASGVQATSPSPTATGSSAKALNGSIPDVISIGRSSISDRSTNASHELEYQVAEAHAKLKKSGEVMSIHNSGRKGSPLFNVGPEGSLDFRNNEGTRSTSSVVAARAVSGEILMSKGSPLFVPSKRHLSYSGTPLNYASNGKPPLAQLSTSVLHVHEGGNAPSSTKQDAQNKANSSSCNPSRAFSEGEVSSLLASRILANNQRSMTLNSYDQTMAQLWEELLAAPTAASKSEEHQHKDGDYQRVRQATMGSISSSSSWEVERTLQNAVELSLQPPLEHLPLLLDCPKYTRESTEQRDSNENTPKQREHADTSFIENSEFIQPRSNVHASDISRYLVDNLAQRGITKLFPMQAMRT